MKKYSDYYLISYKQFNFSCDEYGGFDLVEDIPETAQFLVSSDAESDVFMWFIHIGLWSKAKRLFSVLFGLIWKYCLSFKQYG